MMDEEIGSDAKILKSGELHRCPAIVSLARARIEGGVAGIVVEGIFTRDNDNPDLDRWIHGFHKLYVIPGAGGISERVVGHGVVVGFPGSITFIADFPV